MSQFYQVVTSGNLPPDVPLSIVTDDGTAVAAANILNINGGEGVEVVVTPDGSNNIFVTIDDVIARYTDVTNPNPGHEAYSVAVNTTDDYFISVDSTLGPVTIYLPDSGSAIPPENKSTFVIKDRVGQASSYNITIQSENGLATIEGQASYTFVDDFESLECLFFGTNYEIF